MRTKIIAALLVPLFFAVSAQADILADIEKPDIRFELSETAGSFELKVQPISVNGVPKLSPPRVMTLRDPHRLIIELSMIVDTPYEFVKIKHPLIDRVEYGLFRGQTRIVLFLNEPMGQEFYTLTQPENGLIRVYFARGKGKPVAYVPPPAPTSTPVAEVVARDEAVPLPTFTPAATSAVPEREVVPINEKAQSVEQEAAATKLPPTDEPERRTREPEDALEIVKKAESAMRERVSGMSVWRSLVVGVPILCLIAALFLRRSYRGPHRRSVTREHHRREKGRGDAHGTTPPTDTDRGQSAARLENCYRLVGVSRGATEAEVEASYTKIINTLRGEVLNTAELTPERIAVCQEKIRVIQDSYNRIVEDFHRTSSQRRSH